MEAAKTTFYLSHALRARLKTLAAHRRKTVTELLTEGAQMVLDRYHRAADRESVRRLAYEARDALRRGLYEGPPITGSIDRILYPAPRDAKKPR